MLNGKTAYAYVAYGAGSGHPEGPCYFDLDDPGNITSLGPDTGPFFLAGGTWTIDGRWFGCQYNTGILYEIDPRTGDMWSIGGGGTGCNGLAWDPVYNRLYGTTGFMLVEYNPDTGEQTVIGSHLIDSSVTMIALAINLNGVCYGWDVKFSGESYLYKIDTSTGEATIVGGMGINLCYAQDGAFDWDTGILYLSAYNTSGFLATCDVETAELTVIGDFEGGAELTALAIPYNWGFPQADFIWEPIHPNPGEMILFNASRSIDYNGYILLYEWDWDNDGVFDENHTTPTATHIWPNEGYYPVTLQVTDNSSLTGMKTKTVRIGHKPPEPPIIDGPSNGMSNIKYYYLFVSIDPDGDDISYYINWNSNGDGFWTDWYASGYDVILPHLWPEVGTFTISAMAKDRCGVESNWSYFDVEIPRNRAATNIEWFYWFLERFPLLEVFLRAMNLLD